HEERLGLLPTPRTDVPRHRTGGQEGRARPPWRVATRRPQGSRARHRHQRPSDPRRACLLPVSHPRPPGAGLFLLPCRRTDVHRRRGGRPVIPDAASAEVGDIIESAADPRFEALPAGSVLLDRERNFITKEVHAWVGAGYTPIPDQGDEFGPRTVSHLPEKPA